MTTGDISRLRSSQIQNGNTADASDVDAELNQLVNNDNAINARLYAVENSNLTIAGNKTFSGTTVLGATTLGATSIGAITSTATNTFSGTNTFSNAAGVTTDTLTERTTNAGVTVDGLVIKDGVPLYLNMISGFEVSWTSVTSITVSAGVCVDSAGTNVIKNTSSQVIDITASGAGGLDTGARATDTWYYVWVIGQTGGTASAMISLSMSSPTMPGSYTLKRLVGVIRLNATSSGQVIKFWQYGSGKTRSVYWDDMRTIGTSLSTGTIATGATFFPHNLTKKALVTLVGATNTSVTLSGSATIYAGNSSGNQMIRGMHKFANGTTAGDSTATGVVTLDSSGNFYINKGDSRLDLDAYANGFEFNL